MKVSELLSSSDRWSQACLALSAIGEHVPPRSPQAVCWSLAGAVQRCYEPEVAPKVRARIAEEAKRDGALGPTCWNDEPDTTFSDVRDLVLRLGI